MDTMKLLLGATIALLLGALAVSWQGMVKGVKDSPASEISRLKKQVKELQTQQDKLALERQMQQLQNDPIRPVSEVEVMKNKLEEQRIALEQVRIDDEKAKRDATVVVQEDAEMDQRNLFSKDQELRRANLISQALLMGKVSEYVEDPQGGFITFEVQMPEQVQIGTVLAIRRKTGILGMLKVSDVTTEGAIANVLPGFGPVHPEIGDDLILPPQY